MSILVTPIYIANESTPISKAHIIAICFALAFWLFGLARISYNHRIENNIRFRANVTATLIVFAMIGFVLDLWSMPVAHRLVFWVVFGWTGITAMELLIKN